MIAGLLRLWGMTMALAMVMMMPGVHMMSHHMSELFTVEDAVVVGVEFREHVRRDLGRSGFDAELDTFRSETLAIGIAHGMMMPRMRCDHCGEFVLVERAAAIGVKAVEHHGNHMLHVRVMMTVALVMMGRWCRIRRGLVGASH